MKLRELIIFISTSFVLNTADCRDKFTAITMMDSIYGSQYNDSRVYSTSNGSFFSKPAYDYYLEVSRNGKQDNIDGVFGLNISKFKNEDLGIDHSRWGLYINIEVYPFINFFDEFYMLGGATVTGSNKYTLRGAQDFSFNNNSINLGLGQNFKISNNLYIKAEYNYNFYLNSNSNSEYSSLKLGISYRISELKN